MSTDPIILLHVSDIHFRHKRSGTSYDLDNDLRNELLRDAKTLKGTLGEVTGIVVTGDIAFAGKKEEFEIASIWLDELANCVSCPPEHIWIVPGNHDVDRSAVDGSPMIQTVHKSIRSESDKDLTTVLERFLSQKARDAGHLFEPLEAYRAFADTYGCPTSPECAHWSDDIVLNDQSKLRLVGLNSVIVSNADDDENANRLIINEGQLSFPTEDGVEYLSLCHHPIDWLRNRDNIENKITNRVRIQLFGHKHKHKVRNLDGKSVSVVAGATHPDRSEDNWLPRYNALSILVDKSEGVRKMEVRVYPRVWRDDQKFGPDYNSCGDNGNAFTKSTFVLPEWSAPAVQHAAEPQLTETSNEELRAVKPEKQLVHKFLALPFPKQMEIMVSLSLLEENDHELRKYELFRHIIRRAQETSKLEALWNKVETASDGNQTGHNPFAGR